MRAAVLNGARAALLAGPTALAFFSGGYFDGPRAWAGLLAWALVAIAVFAAPRPAMTTGSWLALGGLAALGVWTLLSITWAPVAGSAYHAGQITILYTGVLLAGMLLLQSRRAQLLVEPALAAGALIVIGYGISERLLPGVLHFARSVSAEGRLEQPLTYWNAMGELAALGFVLATRVAGAPDRAPGVRLAATAAAAPLTMGLYLSFSRGALFACVAGLIALVVLAPERGAAARAGRLRGGRGAGVGRRSAVQGRHRDDRSARNPGAPGGDRVRAAGRDHARCGRGPMAGCSGPARGRDQAAPRFGMDRARGDLRWPGAGDRGRGQGELQGRR